MRGTRIFSPGLKEPFAPTNRMYGSPAYCPLATVPLALRSVTPGGKPVITRDTGPLYVVELVLVTRSSWTKSGPKRNSGVDWMLVLEVMLVVPDPGTVVFAVTL